MVYYATKLIDSTIVKCVNHYIIHSYRLVSGYEDRKNMNKKINRLEQLLKDNSIITEKTFKLLERTENMYEKDIEYIRKDIRNIYNNQQKMKKGLRNIEEYLESVNGYESFKRKKP